MAIERLPVSSDFSLLYKEMSLEGVETTAKRKYAGVKTDATNADVHLIATQLSSLQSQNLFKVTRGDDNKLVSV